MKFVDVNFDFLDLGLKSSLAQEPRTISHRYCMYLAFCIPTQWAIQRLELRHPIKVVYPAWPPTCMNSHYLFFFVVAFAARGRFDRIDGCDGRRRRLLLRAAVVAIGTQLPLLRPLLLQDREDVGGRGVRELDGRQGIARGRRRHLLLRRILLVAFFACGSEGRRRRICR